MRRLVPVLALLAVAPLVDGHDGHGFITENHSPSVLDVSWTPPEPRRGEPVNVWVMLRPNVDVETVAVTVCRVQNYACATPFLLVDQGSAPGGPRAYAGQSPWNDAFFRGVTQVGIAVVIVHQNNTTEDSPVASWPSHPPELPPDSGSYYFYHLPPEPEDSPAPALGALVAAMIAVAWWRRR